MRYSYELFCQRKRFLIKNYFTIYPDASYEDFCLFLTQRCVTPPSEEYFKSQKESLVKSELPTPSKVLEELPDETQKVSQEEVQEVKKPRRRRRSAKKNDS